MISANDALTRALTAIQASRDTAEYHKVVDRLVEMAGDRIPAKSFHSFRDMILAIAADVIRAEFADDDEWQVVQVKAHGDAAVYAIQSRNTGEFYTAKTRGNGRRLVTFRFKERAKMVAHMRNVR